MNEAELVFSEILNCDRVSLYQNYAQPLDKIKSSVISAVLKRRILGEPLQYILGEAEFMGLKFKVNPHVFIPRPETEILVEAAIKIAHASKFMLHSILDLCTGSGCIAISLAKFIPMLQNRGLSRFSGIPIEKNYCARQAADGESVEDSAPKGREEKEPRALSPVGSIRNVRVTATDISNEALEIAKQNALLNNVEVIFLQSNLFANHELTTMNYELIISNPPYIPSAQIKNLQPEIAFEPRIALDAGRQGLDFYRKIIKQAPGYLKKNGFLIMEIGSDQAGAIRNIFQKSQNFEIIDIIKDYNNMDRVFIARKMRKNG